MMQCGYPPPSDEVNVTWFNYIKAPAPTDDALLRDIDVHQLPDMVAERLAALTLDDAIAVVRANCDSIGREIDCGLENGKNVDELVAELGMYSDAIGGITESITN